MTALLPWLRRQTELGSKDLTRPNSSEHDDIHTARAGLSSTASSAVDGAMGGLPTPAVQLTGRWLVFVMAQVMSWRWMWDRAMMARLNDVGCVNRCA